MRTILFAAAAAMVFGLAATAPANATQWTCMGDYVACGDSGKTSKSSSKKMKSAGYGNDGYIPMKKAKKSRKVASYDADGDAPARKSKKSRKVTYSGGGGYSAGGGLASYYWQPQRVASGGWFNPNALTAAHKTLPFGTKVRVTNKHNGRSVVVTINDRGPYIKGRVIDLSSRAAGVIGMKGAGVVPVSMAILGR